MLLLWIPLAFADMPAPEEGEVREPHCVDGRCIGWWEGPYMGGCMGECCNMHGIWLGNRAGEGRLVERREPRREDLGPLTDHARRLHPISVRWTARDEVEVVRRASLLPHDGSTLDRWTLTGLQASGLVAERYALRGDSLDWISTRWVHEGDRELDRTLEAWLPPATTRKTQPVDVRPDKATRRLLDRACPDEHGTVWAFSQGRRAQLWVLGTDELESEPHVTCVVHVEEDGPTAHRLPGEGVLLLSSERACVSGVARGVRDVLGGLACYDLKAPGLLAAPDLSGQVVSSVSAYPLRVEGPGSDSLAASLAVDVVDRDRVVWGMERWSGAADLSARWQAARVDDALVLRVRVRDDRVETGPGPGTDHVELDVWKGTRADGAPPTRLAIVRDGEQVRVRRWRWKGEEVDTASVGSATWTAVPGGYEVVLTLPRGGGLDQAGDYVLGVRASDGEGGQQVIVESRATVTWDNQWPPAAPVWP